MCEITKITNSNVVPQQTFYKERYVRRFLQKSYKITSITDNAWVMCFRIKLISSYRGTMGSWCDLACNKHSF